MRQVPRHDQSVAAYERLAGGLDPLLAVGCQRQIGDAGVAPVQRPFGLAVAGNEAAGYHCEIDRFEEKLGKL